MFFTIRFALLRDHETIHCKIAFYNCVVSRKLLRERKRLWFLGGRRRGDDYQRVRCYRGWPFLSQMDPIVAKAINETRLPGGRGFSYALKEPTRPIPYALAVDEGKYLSIAELRTAGFTAVIDLLPLSPSLEHHRSESLEAGVRYFSVPIDTFPPPVDRVKLFAKIVSDRGNFPLIVYAGNSVDLASLWSAYRYSMGIDRRVAVSEGRVLGLRHNVEEELHWHLLNGKLVSLRPAETKH